MKAYAKESVVRKCTAILESELGSGHAYNISRGGTSLPLMSCRLIMTAKKDISILSLNSD